MTVRADEVMTALPLLLTIPAWIWVTWQTMALRREIPDAEQERWVAAARSSGLALVENTPARRALEGGGRSVELADDGEGRVLRLTAVVAAPLGLAPRHGAVDDATGDPAFDRAFTASSAPVEVLASLDADTRALLVHLTAASWHVALSGGLLRLERDFDVLWGSRDLDAPLATLAGLARALGRRPPSVPAVLAHHVRTDPEPGFVLRCLHALAEVAAPEADAAARWVLAHRQEAGLLRAAAEHLGGTAPLVGLVARTEGPPRVRTWAAERLLALDPAQAAIAVREALDRAGAPRPAGPVAAALLDVLYRVDPTAAEATAARLLDVPDDGFRLPLVRVLEDQATAVLVPRLVAFHERRSGPLADAARRTVRAIRARTEGAAPGQLSLVGDDAAGGLTVSDDAGGVSLAPAEGAPPWG